MGGTVTGRSAGSSLRRRAVVTGVDRIDVVLESAPVPVAGEVLVRMALAGICGSDLHAVKGRHPFVPLPYHPGHEVIGTVEALGTGVTEELLGARVTVEPTLTCGRCKPCLTERKNLCEYLQFFGCGHAEGGMADSFVIGADRLFRLPDDLGDTRAVLIEPLATPVHAVNLAGDVSGRAVAVIGAGTIGLMALAAVRAHGAKFVAMVDLDEEKRARALLMGADVVIDGALDDVAAAVRRAAGESIDVAFDCVAVQTTLDSAISMVLKGGTVVVVGVAEQDVKLPLAVIQDQQVRLQGAATYTTRDYAEAVEILRGTLVAADEIVNCVHDLDDAAAAFTDAASGHFGKVVVRGRPNGDGSARELER